jgi:hypothetical protein
MRKIFGTAILVLLTSNAFAVEGGDDQLMSKWAQTANACRSGSGASIETQKACGEKTEIEIALISRGYCIDEASKTLWSKGQPKNDWGGCKPEN